LEKLGFFPRFRNPVFWKNWVSFQGLETEFFEKTRFLSDELKTKALKRQKKNVKKENN
jgi:hypothetical protein